MVFHWSFSDNKFPQVFRTLLSILVVLNNAVVWMVSIRTPTSKSSSLFSYCTKTPVTVGIIVTFTFHSFFNSLTRSKYLSFFSHSFSFILWSAGTAKSTILQILIFYCIYPPRSIWHKIKMIGLNEWKYTRPNGTLTALQWSPDTCIIDKRTKHIQRAEIFLRRE